MRGLTALLCAVLLLCAVGIGYKLFMRVGEWRGVALLRNRLGTPAANIVEIRVKATASPTPPGSLPAAVPTPAPTVAAPTPSPDPELLEMLLRMDNLGALQAENGELAGWITIPDTRVDYPVMYTPSRPWYYLDRDFTGGRSKSGLPFLDESCLPAKNRHNLLIYGHNMKDGSMFAGLHKFADAEYYATHRTLYYGTPTETHRYRIVAVAFVTVTEDSPCKFYKYTAIDGEAAFAEYARIIKEASLYPDDMDAAYGDELITLCTCSKHADEGRLLVVAKRTA